jgi:hypothetical protein
MNAARRAIEQLESWSDLSSAPASCGTGTAVRSGAHDIVHFHSDHDADLHLTGPAIVRLRAELEQSTAVRLHPGSEWVTVHLDCTGDADLLVTLVSVALKAHSPAEPPSAPPADGLCNLARVEIMPEEGRGAATATLHELPGRALARHFTRGRGRAPHRRTA